MNMLIDDAGQNETPRGVYFVIVVSTGRRAFYNLIDMVVNKKDRPLIGPAFIDNRTGMNDSFHNLLTSGEW